MKTEKIFMRCILVAVMFITFQQDKQGKLESWIWICTLTQKKISDLLRNPY